MTDKPDEFEELAESCISDYQRKIKDVEPPELDKRDSERLAELKTKRDLMEWTLEQYRIVKARQRPAQSKEFLKILRDDRYDK
jgi:hypothetical protein